MGHTIGTSDSHSLSMIKVQYLNLALEGLSSSSLIGVGEDEVLISLDFPVSEEP